MAKLGISTGTNPNDGTGDSLLGGAVKVNSNFDEVYGKLGDGTNLFVGIVSSIAVDGALSISTSYGAPTITGTANTAVINSRQIYTSGVSTFVGDVTAVGVNTFSSAGYDVAGIVTAQQVSLYDSATVAGITTVDSYGINVTGVGTFSNIAVRGLLENTVGLHTVFIDQTGIAATAVNITGTATLGIASITTSHVTTANIATARINSGIITSANIGAGVTIDQRGIDVGQTGIVTSNSFVGNLTGTASNATLAANANGLQGTPNIICANITGTNLTLASGSGANISGVCTASSFSVGANAVVTAARKLSNIASLDATTTATIESAIEAAPNDFTDIAVAGIGTISQLYIDGRTNGLNIIGVTTGLSVPGISTLGIITGATSIQATDVYSNFVFGDVSSATGSPTLTNLAATRVIVGSAVTIDQKNIDAGQTGIITALTFDGNLTGTPTLGTGVTVTAQGLEVAAGIISATTFSGALSGNSTSATTATNVTAADESSDTTCFPLFVTAATGNLPPKTGSNLAFNSANGTLTATTFSGNLTGTPTLGTGVTVTAEGLEVAAGIISATTFSGNATTSTTATTATNVTLADESTDTSCNVLFATAATGNLPPKTGTNLTFNSNSGALTATSFVGALTGNVTGNVSGNVTGNLTGTPTLGTGVTVTAQGLEVAAGIVTAATFTGNVTATTGTITTANITTANVGSAVTSSSTGIVVGAGKSYTGDSSRVISGRWILGANGTSDYTFTGVGFTATENDPDLYLARGNTYEFVNSSGGHPFRIQSTANGSTGAAYGSGVINNDGGNGSTITFEVPFNAPDTLYYQCTAHTGMGGTIFIYPALR